MVENTTAGTPVHERQAVDARKRSYDLRDWRDELDRLLDKADKFQTISLDVARYLHQRIIRSDTGLRDMADILHGKQLGHPLHPILTDMTIGSWSLAFFFDLLSLLPGAGDIRRFADGLTILGTTFAVPTALSGLTDYTTVKRDAARYGALHGLLNGAAFIFYLRSSIARLTGGSRVTALFYGLLGSALITISAWLGGDLVYRHRVGVNHLPQTDVPEWTPVITLGDLVEGAPTRVDAQGVPVLLYRRDDAFFAINAVCNHAGGPLEEGQVMDDGCIECPWHQSVFELQSGEVVHAPATHAQPAYAVRVQDGQIEIRSSRQPEEV